MAKFDKNHYVPNCVLKNFANKQNNGKFGFCYINLLEGKIEGRTTNSSFYEIKLYDQKNEENVKELEHTFNKSIESIIQPLLKKLISCMTETIVLSRNEIELIKKFALIQIYRNVRNGDNYSHIRINKDITLSKYNIKEGESPNDFWKREMMTILKSSWDELLKTDMIGIKSILNEINRSFIMLFKTDNELCINDLGYVTERIPIKLSKEAQEEYIKLSKAYGEEVFKVSDFDVRAQNEIEEDRVYIDNYILFPISSNFSIALVNGIWKYKLLDPLNFNYIPSNLLNNHLSIPETDYVNKDKIKNNKDIIKYKSPDDTYKYKIHIMTENETEQTNFLLINEAYQYIAVKTFNCFINTFKDYRDLKNKKIENIRHDLTALLKEYKLQ